MNLRRLFNITLLTALLALPPALASAAPLTQVTWLGHSAYKVVTPGGGILFIDGLYSLFHAGGGGADMLVTLKSMPSPNIPPLAGPSVN